MTKDEIAAILREIRLEAGFTQKEAAEKIGRKQQTLASWETGQSQPDANTLFVLCSLYGTTVDAAFGFNSAGYKFTKNEIEHIKKYRSLDAHGKKNIDTLLDSECERCREEREAYERDPRSDREILDEILNSTTTYIAAFGGDKELRTETMEEVIETLEILEDIVKKEKEQENKD